MIKRLMLISILAALLFIGLMALMQEAQKKNPRIASVVSPVSTEKAQEPVVQPVVESSAPKVDMVGVANRSQTSTALEMSFSPNMEPDPLIPVEQLQALLPEWMMGYENVDLLSERVWVAEQEVARSRGRFNWPNGSFMEVEITDLGFEPTEDLLKSLGFNFGTQELGSIDDEGPLVKEVNTLVFSEYDEKTSEGFVQLFLENRFLVEIQLEKLPFDSFGVIIENQLDLRKMVDLILQNNLLNKDL